MSVKHLTRINRNQKNYHENTKVRKHERLNIFYFVLSIFRAFVIIF